MTTKATGNPRGRRTKYTTENVDAIMKALRLGMTRRDAGVAGDIDESTFCDWINRRPEFAEAVQKAELYAKQSRVERIMKAGQKGTWQADAWMLERKYADEFAQRMVVRVEPNEAAILKKHGLTPAEAWAQLMQELARADTD